MAAGHFRIAAAMLPLLCAGCASTPEAAPDLDRDAKQFITHPGNSTIYVYRGGTPSLEGDSALWINGRLIGATLPQTYFRINLDPGTQHFAGYGPDNGSLRLETRPDAAYFVRLQFLSGHSRFEAVDSAEGRRELLACCHLLENWRPGQRPLLR